ncbi:MAG: isoaspartyl peptidase/L-asparaginase, partial [Thermoleophilaceae bacterium]
VGDSPLIGAGTYADERCAISATGSGEAIMRRVGAHEVAALIEHRGLTLAEACDRMVGAIEGDAGLIAVDRDGNVAMPFNTTVMHRGLRRQGLTETAVLAPSS